MEGVAHELTRALLEMAPTTRWRAGFTGSDAELMARLLAAAGVNGRIVIGNNEDPISTLSLLDPQGRYDHSAGFWMRQLLENSCKGIGTAVYSLLQRAMGMEYIRLSASGHFLMPPTTEVKFSHVCDEDTLRDRVYVGKHAYCGGEFHFRGATMETNVIVCRGCCFRSLEFPIQMKTYSDLRKYMAMMTAPSDGRIRVDMNEAAQ